jgi:hypothetical protein
MKLNLRPDTPFTDVIGWISSITCEWFEMSLTELSQKKVTIASPRLLTPEESYDVFLASLASVGLALEQTGKYQRVVEAKKDHVHHAQLHFAESSLDNLVLLAVVQGASGRRAVLRAPQGQARIIKVGDRISTRTGLVREILPDRLLVELTGPPPGAHRSVEVVLKPEVNSVPAKASR